MTPRASRRITDRPHRKPGAKPRYAQPAVLNATMEADDKAAIVALGGGNASAGVRRLLAFWRENNTQEGVGNGNHE